MDICPEIMFCRVSNLLILKPKERIAVRFGGRRILIGSSAVIKKSPKSGQEMQEYL